MTILAIELGTKTGFAVGSPGFVISGQWDVGYDALMLQARLDQLADAGRLESLALFPSAASKATLAAAVAAWAKSRGTYIREVNRRAVYKAFTGERNATRADLMLEATLREFEPQGEAEACALAIFDFALGLPAPLAEAA